MLRVGVLKIEIHIPESSSLKEKRAVLRSIKDRMKGTFNVSLCEVDNHDKWQVATFGVSCVSNEKRHVDSTLNKVRDFFEKDRNIVVINHEMEII